MDDARLGRVILEKLLPDTVGAAASAGAGLNSLATAAAGATPLPGQPVAAAAAGAGAGGMSVSSSISFSEIATAAFDAGRKQLATMVPYIYVLIVGGRGRVHNDVTLYRQLLEYEPRAADQVPLLISMRQDVLALDKAVQSCDTDLSEYLAAAAAAATYRQCNNLILDPVV